MGEKRVREEPGIAKSKTIERARDVHATVRKVDVAPPREQLLLIPLALPVSHQDKRPRLLRAFDTVDEPLQKGFFNCAVEVDVLNAAHKWGLPLRRMARRHRAGDRGRGSAGPQPARCTHPRPQAHLPWQRGPPTRGLSPSARLPNVGYLPPVRLVCCGSSRWRQPHTSPCAPGTGDPPFPRWGGHTCKKTNKWRWLLTGCYRK